jgi:hypothetical protein
MLRSLGLVHIIFLRLCRWPASADIEKSGGAEIDKIIMDVEVRRALAAEHRRRADWRKCELSANSLKTEYGHARARRRLILFMIGWTNSFVLDRLCQRMYLASTI